MDMKTMFERMVHEVPGYEAGIAVGFDGKVFGSHSAGTLDLASQAGELSTLMRSYHETWEGLGGIITMGGNDEVLVTTTKHYILLRPHHGKGVFLAVAIASSGNVGYLRLKMKRYLDEMIRG